MFHHRPGLKTNSTIRRLTDTPFAYRSHAYPASATMASSIRCCGAIKKADPATIQKMSTSLLDPNDPLVSTQNLITSAQEVLGEVRQILFSEDLSAILSKDPEWLDASFEYLGEALGTLKEIRSEQ